MRSDELMALAYDDLRAVAEHYFCRQPQGFTLCPTEIVHEACLHLMKHGDPNWTSEGHFRAIAVRKMWQVIVDHLKRRQAQKRGGRESPRAGSQIEMSADDSAAAVEPRKRVPLEHIAVEWHDRNVDLLDLADALADLSRESQRLHDVVLLRWFGGMTHAEVARHFGVSARTVEKDVRYSLAWLNRRLQRTPTNGD